MKRILTIIAFFMFINIFVLIGNSFAVTLDTINVELEKQIIRPGGEVRLKVEFGTALKEYNLNIFYDNNIFEYISSDASVANNTGVYVKVDFFDETNGNNPRSNMNIIFKAKENITTSNPTEFTVTADKLVSSTSTLFDSIQVPIIKNVTVEPEYINYTLNLETTKDIIVNDEIPMKISYSSPMGRYYEGARLIAEVLSPELGALKMIALDNAGLEHDIVQSGWGDPQGFKIGGKDTNQVLNITGIFKTEGNYTVKLKLIDRKNSDQVITENTFNFMAISENNNIMPLQDLGEMSSRIAEENTSATVLKEVTNDSNSINNNVGSSNIVNETNKTKSQNLLENNTAAVPKKLPKTGRNMYIPVIFVVIAFIIGYAYYFNKES